MTTIPQSPELLKHLAEILAAHRSIFKQQRTYQRVVQLVLAELVVLARHTVTQLLMVLGRSGEDWSAWYRLFSLKRFAYEQACQVLLRLTLVHVREDEPYVVAGDGTQRRAVGARSREWAGCGICARRRFGWAFIGRNAGSTAPG